MTKTAVKHTVKINYEMCKGCGLCIAYCTKKVLRESEHLNKAGYHYAEPGDAGPVHRVPHLHPGLSRGGDRGVR